MVLTILLLHFGANAQQPYGLEEGATGVVAHRGFHKYDNAAENSIQALQHATDHDFYGTEFDVQFTLDSVAVVCHDPSINGLPIAQTRYEKLAHIVLSNGEELPTLDKYLQTYKEALDQQRKRYACTRLFMEIKPVERREMVGYAAAEALKAVERYGLKDVVVIISFDTDVCQTLAKTGGKLPVAYLGGNLSPQELYAKGIRWIDYHYEQLFRNPHWVNEAHQLGMHVNAWTVNDRETAMRLMELQVDLITTDNPLDMQMWLREVR